MYSIKKVINNNVVLVIDSKLREFIVLGKGVGFQKKADDLIDDSSIEKRYSLLSGEMNQLLEYITDVDFDLLSMCDTIRTYVERKINMKYTNYMFFSLVDHINEAIIRQKASIEMPNQIDEAELIFYTKEFELSRKTGEIIYNSIEVKLSESELNLIALHFITNLQNAEYSQVNEKVIKITNEIIDIIRYKTMKEIDENFYTKRFIVHLKYFIIRQLHYDDKYSNYNEELFKLLILQYPNDYVILKDIIDFLNITYGFVIEPDEQMYLLMHLVRIKK